MQVLHNYLISRSSWADFFKSSLFASPFQSPEYFDFVNSIPGYIAEAYAVEDDNKLKALCIAIIQKEPGLKTYFSRRAVIYGGPLLCDEALPALELLLKSVSNDLKSKVIYAETRNLNNYEGFKQIFLENGWRYQPELNYHLDTSSQETAWKNFNSTRRRQIKKALKHGVSVEPAVNAEEIKAYYSILNKLYKTKVKKPLPPIHYFLQLHLNGLAKFLLVKYNSKIIGGIVCPVLENKIIYELNICGLDQEYKEAYPSVMATFGAIEYGYNNGYKIFDFMGAGAPDDNYGVRDFKSKFGGKEVENGRFVKVFNPLLYNVGKLAVNQLKWLVK